jgi:hypothetical protein
MKAFFVWFFCLLILNQHFYFVFSSQNRCENLSTQRLKQIISRWRACKKGKEDIERELFRREQLTDFFDIFNSYYNVEELLKEIKRNYSSIESLAYSYIQNFIEKHLDFGTLSEIARCLAKQDEFMGKTILRLAVEENWDDLVRLFLDLGAYPNVSDIDGIYPLHIAAFEGFEDVVVLLVEYGAFLNVKDYDGNSPLHEAVRGAASLDVVKVLLENGADKNLANEDGETPLDLAKEFSSLGEVESAIYSVVEKF